MSLSPSRFSALSLSGLPSLFSYCYWKPAYLLAFLTFNRFACVDHFNPIEPNSEVNGHHGHQLNRHPKLSFRQIPTQSSCPCPVNELHQRKFRSVEAYQLCSESQARNFSTVTMSTMLSALRIIIDSGMWLAQRRSPNDTQTSTRLVKKRKAQSR
jgi:hypothetical protein